MCPDFFFFPARRKRKHGFYQDFTNWFLLVYLSRLSFGQLITQKNSWISAGVFKNEMFAYQKTITKTWMPENLIWR